MTTVRRATAADAPQISEIIAEALSAPTPSGFDGPMSSNDVVLWLGRQASEGGMWVVVDDRAQVLGFATIDFDSSRPAECTFGAWVRQRNRRQGHATQLAEDAIEFARLQGYRRIRGRLPEQNEPALSFLSAIGALVPMKNPGTTFELPIYEDFELPNTEEPS